MPRQRMTRRLRRALRARRSLAPALVGCLAAATLFACKGDETTTQEAVAPAATEVAEAAPSEAVSVAAPNAPPAAPIEPVEDPDLARDRAEIEARLTAATTSDEIKDALSDLSITINPFAITTVAKYIAHSDPAVSDEAIRAMIAWDRDGDLPLRNALAQASARPPRPGPRGLYYVQKRGRRTEAMLVALPDRRSGRRRRQV